MPKVEINTRDATGRGLTELETQRPELLAWLRPLRIALASLESEPWQHVMVVCSGTRAPEDPMLHGAVVPVDTTQVNACVRSVLHAALGSVSWTRIDTIDGLHLLELAIASDHQRVASLAEGVNIDAHALDAAAQLAAMPMLIACTRALSPQPRHDWSQRFCHVCGALPALVEVVGLERARHLRCARCGAGWKANVLLCPFCDERDHARLGSLMPDGPQGQICWVETCQTCSSYIKARAALRGAALEHVLIEDARTLELDIAAAERGFQKPDHRAFATALRFTRANVVN
jgi:formate dehydrogenase maturation protein FdhE